MRARTLAFRTGTSVLEAEHLLRALARAYPTFTKWQEQSVDAGVLTGRMTTVFGWPIHVTTNSRPTALRNYPMQANGAEMLRIACCLATERGIDVCAPVHDALLVEGLIDGIDDVVATTRDAMTEAARAVLDGIEVGTETAIVRAPARYSDPRGEVM
jgi:DNA polymerase I